MPEQPPLPDFAEPPVNEVALSIQFAPIARFSAPYFGLFWQQIRSQYGRVETHPAIPSLVEQFDSNELSKLGELRIQLASEVGHRCWFLDASSSRLIQVQRDRFIHNWRQITGEEPYPRYPSIRQSLRDGWRVFKSFLLSEGFAPPRVTQCEVTYINHIDLGQASYGALSGVLSLWTGKGSVNFLPQPEGVHLALHYRLPEDRGRLHIVAQPVIRGRDGREVLQIDLTARGAPRTSSDEHVFEWLDLGRDWVVNGFTDLTTEGMHKKWGRKQ